MYFKNTFTNFKSACFIVPAVLSFTAGYSNITSGELKVNINRETLLASAIQQTVRGKVVDETGLPLPGATIMVTGTSVSAVTDIDGNFEIAAANGATLDVVYVGYKTQTVTITGTTVTVNLVPNASELNEVVVVGYGRQSKKDVTGSVSQISESQFRQGVNISTDQLLQGKIAGVRVTPTSGEPGAGINVNIRGVGSIRSGSTPLFVVDGVPLTNDGVSPTGANVGFGSSAAKNPLNFLNTSDIESISVLKDASAAAIYGARGSNGVVIVTTKRGAKGKASFTVDSYLGLSKIMNKLDVLSADEYRSAITNPAYDHGGNTDWQDVIFRDAVTKNNSFAFSKGTDSGNYYVSVAQMDQEGIVNNNNFRRTSGRINASESFLDDKRLKIKVNLTASETKDDGVPTSDDGGSDGQLIIHTLMANPTRSVFDENGDYTNFNMNAHYNPAYLLSIYEDVTRTTRILGNMETSFRILKGLEYKLNLGIDRSIAERNTTIYRNLTDRSTTGRYVQSNVDSKNTLLEHYLTYDFLTGKHKFDALAGFSYQKFETGGTTIAFEQIGTRGEGIRPSINPGYRGVALPASGFAQINELQSYFGRINYAFDGKYLLTASLRADGSTRFGANNKYGYFPSAAAGWNISEENFLKESNVVNNLKLRASWGQTGNQEVLNKQTKESYSLTPAEGYYLYDGLELVNGISFSRTANPDLKWEVVTQFNVGLDFNLWADKLYGSVDYFNKATTDAILYIPAPAGSPTNDIWVNMDGKIVNSGIEFMLGSKIVNTEDFTWDLDVNGATLKNEIKDLPVSQILSGTVSGPGLSGVLGNIYKNGYAAGSFYMKEHIGFDENGGDRYKDQNGDGRIDNSDNKIYEGAIPKFTYGLNSNMRYKAFDFSFSIIGQTGGYLLNNTNLNALNINNLASDRNTLTNYIASGASQSNAPQLSSLYLEKSDFIRLNSARIGYTFKHPSLAWMDSLNLYITGQNLFTITDYSGFDPLINSNKANNGNQSLGIDYGSYPTARTLILGATFKI
jgi:TonB-linked SusC/RagA family outer membrane protein